MLDVAIGICGIGLLTAIGLSVRSYIRERRQWKRDLDTLENLKKVCGTPPSLASEMFSSAGTDPVRRG